MPAPAVGIDLGTTNSVVAVSSGGRPQVLLDAGGSPLIPSVVSFPEDGERIVGRAARRRRAVDPRNTVYSVKRLIGRPFKSEEVRRARSRVAFDLKEGPDSSVLVSTRAGDLSLPELSAIVLREVRRVAEDSLGDKVEKCVVTVPANFNELQRSSTKIAGRIAELDVVRILNEPTAAALAYGYGRGTREKICIFDFGGGTFDVTLLELSGNVFEVLATAGDTFLGGDDVDIAIADSLVAQFERATKINPLQDRVLYDILRDSAEDAKCALATRESAELRVQLDHNGRDVSFSHTLSRAELERLSNPLVSRTFDVCGEALKLAGLRATDLTAVILVGGSTRIPTVRQRVASFFGREPLSNLPPEEVVALGASILAEALSGGARRGQHTRPMAPNRTTTVHPAPAPVAGPVSAGVPGATRPSAPPRSSGDLSNPGARNTLTGVGDETSGANPLPRRDPSHSGPLRAPTPPPLPPGVGPSALRGPTPPPLPPGARNPLRGATPPPIPGRAAPPPLSKSTVPPPAPPAPPDPTGAFQLDDPFADPGSATIAQPPLDERTVAMESPVGDLGTVDEPSFMGRIPKGAEPPAPPAPSFNLEESSVVAPMPRMRAPTIPPNAKPALGAPPRRPSMPEAPAVDEGPIGLRPEIAAALPPSIAAAISGVPSRPPPGAAPVKIPSAPATPRVEAPAPPPPAPPPIAHAHGVKEVSVPSFKIDDELASHEPSGAGRTDVSVPSFRLDDELTTAHATTQLAGPAATRDEPTVAVPVFSGGTTQKMPAAVPPPAYNPSAFRGPTGPVVPAAPPPPSGFPPPAARAPTHHPPPHHPPSQHPPSQHPPSMAPGSVLPPPLLLDVTPFSLGVETAGGLCETVIQRNATIPVEQTRNFATVMDNQTAVIIRIAQGESRRFGDNQPLGQLELSGLRPAARGEVVVAVTFELEADGTLSARDRRRDGQRAGREDQPPHTLPSESAQADMAAQP
ncbi:MAG: Hsp70 family protein [Polyangiales bacterium]